MHLQCTLHHYAKSRFPSRGWKRSSGHRNHDHGWHMDGAAFLLAPIFSSFWNTEVEKFSKYRSRKETCSSRVSCGKLSVTTGILSPRVLTKISSGGSVLAGRELHIHSWLSSREIYWETQGTQVCNLKLWGMNAWCETLKIHKNKDLVQYSFMRLRNIYQVFIITHKHNSVSSHNNIWPSWREQCQVFFCFLLKDSWRLPGKYSNFCPEGKQWLEILSPQLLPIFQ